MLHGIHDLLSKTSLEFYRPTAKALHRAISSGGSCQPSTTFVLVIRLKVTNVIVTIADSCNRPDTPGPIASASVVSSQPENDSPGVTTEAWHVAVTCWNLGRSTMKGPGEATKNLWAYGVGWRALAKLQV